MNPLAQLTDASLHSELKRLVGSSNTLTAQLLAHLGEVEARGIHRERACSSLYTYCVYELCMSEDEAQRRCRAARLARQFPVLLEMLAEASLHLTGILLLGPHLTDANCAELLARARFRTKREIERLVAEIAPCPDVPSRIVPLHRAGVAGAAEAMVLPLDEEGTTGKIARRHCSWAAYVRSLAGAVRELEAGLGAGQAPPRASEEEGAAATRGQTSSDAMHDCETGARTPAIDARQDARTPAVDARQDARTPAIDTRQDARTPVPSGESQPTAFVPPVAELRYKVQFTADQAYVDLLEEARNLLQHQLPGRDLVEVQRRALELLVRKLRQRKHAACERPRRKAPEPASGAPQPKSASARSPAPQSATSALHSAQESATHARHSPPPSANQGRHSPPPSATRDRHSPPPSTNPGRHSPPPSTNQGRHSPPPSATRDRHSPPPSAQGRHISAEVRRGVWQRDGARCTYVDARGQRCREQAGLEFHHQHPHARRGPPTLDNLTLRCRSHNALAAEQDFGRDVIRQKRARKATSAEPTRAGAAP